MNRRAFLSLFGAAAAAVAVKPTYFFAPIGGWSEERIIPVTLTINSGSGYWAHKNPQQILEDINLMMKADPVFATGVDLDRIGALNFMVRMPGEPDDNLRRRYYQMKGIL